MVLWNPALIELAFRNFSRSGLGFGWNSNWSDALRLGQHWNDPGLVSNVSTGTNNSKDEKIEEENLRIQQARRGLGNRDGPVISRILHRLVSLILWRKHHNQLQYHVLRVHIWYKRVRDVHNSTDGDNLQSSRGGQVSQDIRAVILAEKAADAFDRDGLELVVGDLEIQPGDATVDNGDPKWRFIVWERKGDLGFEIYEYSAIWELAVLINWR